MPQPFLRAVVLAVCTLVIVPHPAAASIVDMFNDVQTEDTRLRHALQLIEADEAHRAEVLVRSVIAGGPGSAAAQEVLGMALAKQGKLDEAIAALAEASKLQPARSGPYTKLGDVLQAMGKTAEARAAFEQALSLNPTDRQAQQRMGLILESEGDLTGAILHYEKGLAGTPPEYLGIKVNLALLYNQVGTPAKSIALLEPLAATTSQPIVQRALANAYLGVGQPKPAIAAYRAALMLDPTDALAGVGLGMALRATGDMPGSVAALEAAVRLAPASTTALIELARSRAIAGQTAAAIAGLQAASQGSPDRSMLELALADIQAASGAVDAAAQIYSDQIDQHRALPETYVQLGALQQQGLDFDAAEATYLAMKAAYPDTAAPLFRLGSLYGLQQRYQLASDSFDAALVLDPDAPAILRAAAWSHQALGQGDTALALARRLSDRAGAGPEDLFFLATMTEATGRQPEAITLYRRVVADAPEYWPALNNLAAALTESGDAAEAVRLAARAVAIVPENAVVRDTYGLAQMGVGKTAEAAAMFAGAVALEPENPVYNFHLAQAEAGQGNVAAAKGHAQAALTLAPDFPQADQARKIIALP